MNPEVIDGPGTEAYSPLLTPQDGVLVYRTRSTVKNPPNGAPVQPGTLAENLMPPDPSKGGEMGPSSQLGWSTGFGKLSRRTSFTGRVITRPTMGANPATGPVGYSTRTSRLRARIEALYNDYTPSNQAVAMEVIEGDNG